MNSFKKKQFKPFNPLPVVMVVVDEWKEYFPRKIFILGT